MVGRPIHFSDMTTVSDRGEPVSEDMINQKLEDIIAKLDRLHKHHFIDEGDPEREFMFEVKPNGTRLRRPRTFLSHDELWLFTRNEIAARDSRAKHFHAAALSDVSWNILLDLHLNRIESRLVSVSSACAASRAPPTTALRHLEILEALGLIFRERDMNDKRRCWVALSDHGARSMVRYIDQKRRRTVKVRPTPRLRLID